MRFRLAERLPSLAFIVLVVVAPLQVAHSATKEEALARCDALASDPLDPKRFAPGVSQEQFAPGVAIEACKAAVEADSESPRAWFELGRSYWIGEEADAAYQAFVEAAKRGYAPAMKYIGDAYAQGRGLPEGQRQSPDTALQWYKKAQSAGLRGVDADVQKLEATIASLTFQPELFQNPAYMSRIYGGDFNGIEDPITFFAYTKAFIDKLGGNEVFFIHQDCTGMVTMLGSGINGIGEFVGYLQGLQGSGGLGGLLVSMVGSTFTQDQGERDAVTLMNRYTCDSPITRRIVDNVSGSYKKMPAVLEAFTNSKEQVARRASGLTADIRANCERTFDRPGFCSCAAGGLSSQRLSETELGLIRSDFRNVASMSKDKPSLMEVMRACYKTPT